jgi:ribosomal protein L37AE/L43A
MSYPSEAPDEPPKIFHIPSVERSDWCESCGHERPGLWYFDAGESVWECDVCGAVQYASEQASVSDLRARLEALSSAERVKRRDWCPACDRRRPGVEYLLHGAPVWVCDECGGTWWVTNGWREP